MKIDLFVTMEWLGKQQQVGELIATSNNGKEHYLFVYSKEWANEGFAIDPSLNLVPGIPYHSSNLWGVFQDISPDRWGRLVQDRSREGHSTAADYMLGVSDYMRMGALRLSKQSSPYDYLAQHTSVPTLASLRGLEEASRRLEDGLETDADIQLLLEPGSSLGGAHPKAAIEDQGHLFIAKFQSRMSIVRTSSWEATLLEMAKIAGLNVAKHQLINPQGERPILLVKRFDRKDANRIPFASAMTLMSLDDESADDGSYIELADIIKKVSPQPKIDQYELWRRMTFNAMVGNIDDHLRNHGFLHDQQGWRLSPAFDINPVAIQLEKRRHALSFDGERLTPSLKTCVELAPYFDVDKTMIDYALLKIGKSLESWQDVARENTLEDEEIKRMEKAFNHEDTERLVSQI